MNFKIFSIGLLILCLSSCGNTGQNNSFSQPSVVFGDEDFVEVNTDGDNTPATPGLLDAIGLSPGGCTLSHLGGGYALSAGHCFANAPFNKVNHVPCNHLIQNDNINFSIVWSYRGQNNNLPVSYCHKIILAEWTEHRDFALIQITSAPKAQIELSLTSFPPAINSSMTIFSHPESKRLQWSKWCRVLRSNYTQFGYQCDTAKGSSGAPIFNHKLQLIGIHNGAKDDNNLLLNVGTAASEITKIISSR